MKEYLCPTYFIESEHPMIREFAEEHNGQKKLLAEESDKSSEKTNIEKAVSIYYAVRDKIRYNPYSIELAKESMRAGTILEKGQGYCVAKAVVLAACLRSQGIPARLGFADVRNHLTTERLKKLMSTDIFVYHGFTDIFLNGKWVKATPAFNLSLCTKFNVKPLEFDGLSDSIFHPYDNAGNQHMEYIREHGTFADLPWNTIAARLRECYPMYDNNTEIQSWDFHTEVPMANHE